MMYIYIFIVIKDKDVPSTEMCERILSVNNSASVRRNEADSITIEFQITAGSNRFNYSFRFNRLTNVSKVS